jgi:hypothetical protein
MEDNKPKEILVECDIDDSRLSFATVESGKVLNLFPEKKGTKVICTATDITREELIKVISGTGLSIIE